MEWATLAFIIGTLIFFGIIIAFIIGMIHDHIRRKEREQASKERERRIKAETEELARRRKLREEKELLNFKRSRHIPAYIKNKVWTRDGGKCVICGSGYDLEFDHIIPFSRGGSNSENNVQLLCMHCNRSKSAKIM